MAMMTTDADALLRAILAAPADDAPRLALADWLDDNGQPERAGFVRGQLALARDFPGVYAPCVCAAAEDKFHCDHCLDTERAEPLLVREWAITKRLVPGKDLLTFECLFDLPLMTAVGNAYGHMRRRYRRGLIDRVEMTADAFMAHAPALFALHPITDVRLAGREPAEHYEWVDLLDSGPVDGYWWSTPDLGNESMNRLAMADGTNQLPAPLSARLAGGVATPYLGPGLWTYRVYPSRDLANAALSRACVAYGRAAAGLDPIKETT